MFNGILSSILDYERQDFYKHLLPSLLRTVEDEFITWYLCTKKKVVSYRGIQAFFFRK